MATETNNAQAPAEDAKSAPVIETEEERKARVNRELRSILFGKYTPGVMLIGMVFAAIVFVGQVLSIGFHAAWTFYKYWWIASPLFGPAFFYVCVLPMYFFEGLAWVVKRTFGPKYVKGVIASLIIVGIVAILFFGGYSGARENNQILSSQPANLDGLTKVVGDQSRVLGNLSESGKTLLGQLNSTEVELENAKKQLSVTLTNFDAQRQAAEHVTDELKRLDNRQKQIALQAEQLQKILDGQQPITRRDLQRANTQGLISGLLVGFLTSFLASMAYNAFAKRTPAQPK